MLYFVEFAFVVLVLIGVALWAVSLLSPWLCVLLYAAFAYWLIRQDGLVPAAVSGVTLALLVGLRLVL